MTCIEAGIIHLITCSTASVGRRHGVHDRSIRGHVIGNYWDGLMEGIAMGMLMSLAIWVDGIIDSSPSHLFVSRAEDRLLASVSGFRVWGWFIINMFVLLTGAYPRVPTPFSLLYLNAFMHIVLFMRYIPY